MFFLPSSLSFIDAVTETTSKIVIGYGLDEAVQMGPLH
ncbi:unnamed protein product, partial [marine sediment metagenome]